MITITNIAEIYKPGIDYSSLKIGDKLIITSHKPLRGYEDFIGIIVTVINCNFKDNIDVAISRCNGDICKDCANKGYHFITRYGDTKFASCNFSFQKCDMNV